MEKKQRYTLGKNERLKSRKLIGELFKTSKSITSFPIRIVYQIKKEPAEFSGSKLQAGFSVSSKNFKKAVDRNRIKRLMREAYRLQKSELGLPENQLEIQLIFFIIYTGKELPAYQLVFDKVRSLLVKLQKISNETIAANS